MVIDIQTIRKIVKEYYVKKRQDNTELEIMLNKFMGSEYEWWKGIKIDEVSYSELSETVTLYGVLTVDEDWVHKQWRVYVMSIFPTLDDDYDLRLGDITGGVKYTEISNNILDVIRFATPYHQAVKVRPGQLHLELI